MQGSISINAQSASEWQAGSDRYTAFDAWNIMATADTLHGHAHQIIRPGFAELVKAGSEVLIVSSRPRSKLVACVYVAII